MTKSHIGKSFHYAVAAPATNDPAGFQALTWVKVPGYSGGFQFGGTHADIDNPDMEQGKNPTLRGMVSFNESTGQFRRRDGAEGEAQDDFIELIRAGLVNSIKIARGSGSAMADGGREVVEGDQVEYATGYFKADMDEPQTDNTREGFGIPFKQNDYSVKSTQPASGG